MSLPIAGEMTIPHIVSLCHGTPISTLGKLELHYRKGCHTALPPRPCPPPRETGTEAPEGHRAFCDFSPSPWSPPLANFSQTHCLLQTPFTSHWYLRSRENYLLTLAPEDKEPLFILLAVAEGDKATFEVFKVVADPCGDEVNLGGEKGAKCHTKVVSP